VTGEANLWHAPMLEDSALEGPVGLPRGLKNAWR
jgi:hypothetical protein